VVHSALRHLRRPGGSGAVYDISNPANEVLLSAFGAVVAYGVILYSLSYRFLPLFPQEREIASR